MANPLTNWNSHHVMFYVIKRERSMYCGLASSDSISRKIYNG